MIVLIILKIIIVNLLLKYKISCWRKSVLRLKNLIKETLNIMVI